MPQLYAKKHDTFVHNYLAKGSEEGTKPHEIEVVGKTKSNFIFPIKKEIRLISSVNNTLQFIATFKTEKVTRQQCHLLLNSDGTIDSISSSNKNTLLANQQVIRSFV